MLFPGLQSGLVAMVFGVMMVGATAVRGQSGAAAPMATGARQAIDEATKAEASGRKREAIEEYKRAYALSGDATLLFRLGELSREIGETGAAERFYRAYLARDRRGTHREAAEHAIRTLEVEELAPASASRPASPAPTQPAAEDARRPAAPPALGPAAAGAKGPSSPILDPLLDPPASEGPASRTTTSAMTTATASSPLPSPASPPLPRWVPWAGLALTVALGADAVYSGLSASRRYDELSSSCGRTSAGCAQGDIDQLKARVLVANLLWAGAGLSALATGVTVYVNTRESGVSGVWRF